MRTAFKQSLATLRWFLLIAIGVSGAACDAVRHEQFVASGPGIDLYSSDIREATDNLNTYLGYVCEQADIPAGGEPDHPRCPINMSSPEWSLVVATGMNDIDRRCDDYLAWLDNERRTRNYVNAQFGHIRTLTSGLLGLATSNVDTITTVAVALGFAQDSYNSYQNRLLLDIEGSTVQSIVIKRRLDYRHEFATTEFRFKPDAVRVLRDYLRICTPYAISMSINTYSRAQVTGGETIEQQETDNLGETLLSTKALRAETAVDVRIARPVVIEAPGGWSAINRSSRPIDMRTAQTIQTALCMTKVDGVYGKNTETHLKIFESVLKTKMDGDLAWEDRIVEISGADLSELRRDNKACPEGAANYLERTLFSIPGNYDRIKEKLKAQFPNEFGNGDAATVRGLIKRLRAVNGLSVEAGDPLTDQITPDLLLKADLL